MIRLETISKDEALRYMGHHGEVSDSLRKIVDDCERKLLEVIHADYIFRVFDIVHCEEGVRVCGSSLVFKGNDIANHLEGCKRAVLMCATLGNNADRLIRATEVNDISTAFVMDAMASAAIEDVCRIADEQIKEQIPDSYFTWRFSAGYGDFPIEIQREFLETLNAHKRIGLCADENNILIPRKSVTAVAGISDKPVPKKRRGCACCNMSDSCAYRKRGDHCGF
jgi:5-methyltetrahydrofolate--homocysteine methyltransferase